MLAVVACAADAGRGTAPEGPKEPPVPIDPLAGYSLFVSQDGAQVTSTGEARYGAVLLSSDGQREFPFVSDTAPMESPAPSPDGRQIAFVRTPRLSSQGALHLKFRDDVGSRVVSPADASCLLPEWSPDGKSVLFSLSQANSPHRLALVSSDGSGLRTITGADLSRLGARWSPGGRRLVYYASHPGTYDFNVFVSDADGSKETAVTQTTRRPDGKFVMNLFPAWSPDGERIAYVRDAAALAAVGQRELVVVNADGTDPRVLASVSWGITAPIAWSPDGSKIIVVNPTEQGRLYAIALAGGALMPYSASTGYGSARWLKVSPIP